MIARAPWKIITITGFPTVGELATAAGTGAATVGFALGSGTLPGMAGLAGVNAVCLPWGAAAVAAARLQRSDDGRWKGVVAQGALNGLKVPQRGGTPTYTTQWNGAWRNLTRTSFSQGALNTVVNTITNRLSTAASLRITGTADDYVTINGRRAAGFPTATYMTVDDTIPSVPAGADLILELHNPTGGFAGVNLTFTFTSLSPTVADDPRVVALENAERAIPLLDATAVAIYGNTVPWWPTGETLARGGNWMRRRSWADAERRIRFEPGPGTAAEVAVLRDESTAVPIPLRSQDFGTAEFLAQDWESYFIPDPNALIDVTDFRFASELGGGAGFYFAVGGDSDTDSGSGSGGEDRPPGTGDFVRMARNGIAQWVNAKEYEGCPEET